MARTKFETAVDDCGHAVGLLVRRVRAAAASQELSWSEGAVMKQLLNGPATTAELARSQSVRPQSMGTIVATLEEMGLVVRKPHPTDGRQINVELTPKGIEVRKRTGEMKMSWLVQAIAKLSPVEQETLFAASKIMRRMAEGDPQ